MAEASRLFKPLKIGSATLSNRLVLAPLTRFRSDDNNVVLPFVSEYYAQRGSYSGTLLITEATFISPQAAGYPSAPGIWSQEQIKAWKSVVEAVHAKGSYIYLQLWALGRAAKPDELSKFGLDVVAPSPLAIGDRVNKDTKPHEQLAQPKPRELKEEEIQQLIKDYAQAAKNAVEGAGFDGVEIHGANGYLPDQFLQDVSNKRTDKWGGSIENRSRFPLEVTKAVVAAVGAEKTGIRLSPWSEFQDMKMEDPIPQFTHLIGELKKLKLAYLHVVESRIFGSVDKEEHQVVASETNDSFIKLWGKTSPVLLAGGFKPESARKLVDEERPNEDIGVVFGRYWIPNPDLVYRIKKGIELTQYDRKTFYNPRKPEGYIDYPFSEEFQKESRL